MEKYSLAWKQFDSHTRDSFKDLLDKGDFIDVTLACEGYKQTRAHKFVLAACSSFFRNILLNNPHKNPVIYLDGVKKDELDAILDFVYRGKAEVAKDNLEGFMRAGAKLKINGLTTEIKQSEENMETKGDDVVEKKAFLSETVEPKDESANSSHEQMFPTEDEVLNPPQESIKNTESSDIVDLTVDTISQAKPEDDMPNLLEEDDDNIEGDKNSLEESAQMSSKADSETPASLKSNLVTSPMIEFTHVKPMAPPAPVKPKKRKTRELPTYQCEECEMNFAEIGNMRMHQFYKHGGKTYPCNQCDHKASRASGLKFHMQMKHKQY